MGRPSLPRMACRRCGAQDYWTNSRLFLGEGSGGWEFVLGMGTRAAAAAQGARCLPRRRVQRRLVRAALDNTPNAPTDPCAQAWRELRSLAAATLPRRAQDGWEFGLDARAAVAAQGTRCLCDGRRSVSRAALDAAPNAPTDCRPMWTQPRVAPQHLHSLDLALWVCEAVTICPRRGRHA